MKLLQNIKILQIRKCDKQRCSLIASIDMKYLNIRYRKT